MSNIAIASDYVLPGYYVRINFGAGPSNAGSGQRPAIYYGAKTTAGTAAVNVRQTITSADQAYILFGKSPLWWAIKSHFECWKKGKVYAVCHLPSHTGGGLLSATATITFAETATAAGFVTIKMFRQKRVVSFPLGATPAVIAALVEEAIEGMGWVVSASVADGVVTITAPIPGVSQNGIYAISATISAGVTTTCTVSATSLGSGADGTTTELSLLDAALDANVAEESYYVGVTHKQVSTANGHLETHMAGRLAANLSNRGRAFIAGRDVKSTLMSSAVAMNYERASLVSEPVSEYDPAWLTGQALAWTQASESLNRAVNMTRGHREEANAVWHLQPIEDTASRMTGDDRNDMMIDGCWVIASNDTTSYLEASLTTASKDATGAVNDRRKWSTHVVSIADHVADIIEVRCAAEYGGFTVRDDTFNAAGALTTKFVDREVTPSQYKAFIIAILRSAEVKRMLFDVDAVVASIYTGIDVSNVNRIECTFDMRAVSLLMQTANEINEVTPG